MFVGDGVTFDDLAEVIAGAGLPVSMPGETGAALPCVQLVPRAMQLHPGNRFAYHVCDVVIVFPLTPFGPQFDALETATVDVLQALTGTSYQLDPTILHGADPAAEPPYQSNTIDVRFVGPDVC